MESSEARTRPGSGSEFPFLFQFTNGEPDNVILIKKTDADRRRGSRGFRARASTRAGAATGPTIGTGTTAPTAPIGTAAIASTGIPITRITATAMGTTAYMGGAAIRITTVTTVTTATTATGLPMAARIILTPAGIMAVMLSGGPTTAYSLAGCTLTGVKPAREIALERSINGELTPIKQQRPANPPSCSVRRPLMFSVVKTGFSIAG